MGGRLGPRRGQNPSSPTSTTPNPHPTSPQAHARLTPNVPPNPLWRSTFPALGTPSGNASGRSGPAVATREGKPTYLLVRHRHWSSASHTDWKTPIGGLLWWTNRGPCGHPAVWLRPRVLRAVAPSPVLWAGLWCPLWVILWCRVALPVTACAGPVGAPVLPCAPSCGLLWCPVVVLCSVLWCPVVAPVLRPVGSCGRSCAP